MNTLYIVRGLPGSGKSTLAKRMANALTCPHFETDQYFERSGTYVFDPTRIAAAHDWCHKSVAEAIKFNHVVVSNTFIQNWELEEYINDAIHAGAKVTVIQCNGAWPSVHGVPEKTLERMKQRFVDNKVLAQKYAKYVEDGKVSFEYN